MHLFYLAPLVSTEPTKDKVFHIVLGLSSAYKDCVISDRTIGKLGNFDECDKIESRCENVLTA